LHDAFFTTGSPEARLTRADPRQPLPQ